MLDQYLSPQGRLSYRKHKRQQHQETTRLDLMEWMLKYRAMLAPERPFHAHPYLEAIYRDNCREMVIYKAAQLGASEYLVSWILWAADVKNATGLYIMPNDTHVSDFSAARLGPAIEVGVSEYLSKIIVSGSDHEKRGADRVGLRRVRNRFVYFRGAKVSPDGRAPQIKSVDADAIVLDEFDEMDVRAPSIVRKRLLASKFAQIRIASTPTYPEMGIHAEYLNSDRRQWHIPCLSCGKLHAPKLEDLIIERDAMERPVRWNLTPDGLPFVKCPSCGGILDRDSGKGEWVAEFPERNVHGYHLFRLSLPSRTLPELIKALDETNETKRQQAVNQDWGLPFTPSSAQSLTDTVLNKARRDYGLGIGAGMVQGETCYGGIDVGAQLHVIVRGTLPDGSRPLRFAGVITSFDDVRAILEKYRVKVAVVDGLPEGRKARELQQKFPRYRLWLAYYAEGETTKKEMLGVWDAQDGTVNIDRTRSLDSTFAAFHNAASLEKELVAGSNTLPMNISDVRDYITHLKAPRRIVRENTKGEQIAVYVETGPDHYAHAENYCLAARECPHGTGWARGAAN